MRRRDPRTPDTRRYPALDSDLAETTPADSRNRPRLAQREVASGRIYRWCDLEWLAIAAPGHDPGALMFYCAEERTLMTGDALWENGFGIVLPDDPADLEQVCRTLDAIAALDIRVVIPGHGLPFAGVAGALER